MTDWEFTFIGKIIMRYKGWHWCKCKSCDVEFFMRFKVEHCLKHTIGARRMARLRRIHDNK